MRVLALEPYYGGSHREFLDGWIRHSRHRWTTLVLPAHGWKWRSRHAALTFSRQLQDVETDLDIVFATDMLNLAELRGLTDKLIAKPSVLYFHESQFSYPTRQSSERDLHFAYSHLVSAAAADELWFNSAFHKHEFFDQSRRLLRRMPDFSHVSMVDGLQKKSRVQYPGVDFSATARASGAPYHLLWVARWEHDKNPEQFFRVLGRLVDDGLEFRVSVLGEQFEDVPSVFEEALEMLGDRVAHWGYQKDRTVYESILADADIVVSTAQHEFFGMGIVKAIGHGCYPVLPDRLSYPELLGGVNDTTGQYLYDGSDDGLFSALSALLTRTEGLWTDGSYRTSLLQAVQRFHVSTRVPAMDDALEQVLGMG